MAVGGGQHGGGRVEARENAGASGRAKRAGGVGPGEGHTALGEPIEVGGLVELGVTVNRGVGPAEVVGKNIDDVGLLFSVQEGREEEGEERNSHVGR